MAGLDLFGIAFRSQALGLWTGKLWTRQLADDFSPILYPL